MDLICVKHKPTAKEKNEAVHRSRNKILSCQHGQPASCQVSVVPEPQLYPTFTQPWNCEIPMDTSVHSTFVLFGLRWVSVTLSLRTQTG